MRSLSLVRHITPLFAVACLALTPVAHAQTTITFDTTGTGTRIVNNQNGHGEVNGTEWANLGVFFTPQGTSVLDIAVGSASMNALGADTAAADDFNGTILTTFALGGRAQTTASVDVLYDNNTSRTIIRDVANNILLDTVSQRIIFANPNIASIESRLAFDAIDTFTFGRLSPVVAVTPEPGSVALLIGLGTTGAGFLSRRRRQQAKNAA